jgi:hypothetical protein
MHIARRLIGEPRSPAQFREINLRGGVIILTAALLPLIASSLWRHRGVRNGIVVIGWIALVGCSTHAITNETLRLLSLTGVHPIEVSAEFWLSVNRHKADRRDVLLNEPWFFIEGCLWGLFALTALAPSMRRRWLHSAGLACAVASIFGVLSGLGAVRISTRVGRRVTPIGSSSAANRKHAARQFRSARLASRQYNVSDYSWFDLRDASSAGPSFEGQYGLLYDDYSSKPAFGISRELNRGVQRSLTGRGDLTAAQIHVGTHRS